MPESVRYDSANDVFYVSNINGAALLKANKGFISRMKPRVERQRRHRQVGDQWREDDRARQHEDRVHRRGDEIAPGRPVLRRLGEGGAHEAFLVEIDRLWQSVRAALLATRACRPQLVQAQPRHARDEKRRRRLHRG